MRERKRGRERDPVEELQPHSSLIEKKTRKNQQRVARIGAMHVQSRYALSNPRGRGGEGKYGGFALPVDWTPRVYTRGDGASIRRRPVPRHRDDITPAPASGAAFRSIYWLIPYLLAARPISNLRRRSASAVGPLTARLPNPARPPSRHGRHIRFNSRFGVRINFRS